MKKYITLAALLVAGAAFTNAEETLVLLPALSTTALTIVDDKGNGWKQDIGTDKISEDVVKSDLGISTDLSSSGWHWSVANTQNPYSDAGNVVSSVTSNGFTLTGRGGYGGSFVAATVNLEDILEKDTALNSLSLSFTATSVNSLYFSLWSWNGTTATELGKDTSIAAGDVISVSESNLELVSSDTIIAIWGSDSRGGDSVISGISSSYTTIVIPEPSAFGLLAGLGALALVGTRRRRK